MHHQLTVLSDAAAVAAAAARFVASRAREASDGGGGFVMAASGGRTPWAMYAALATEELAWDRITIYQVDERVAPPGDQARNLTHLERSLSGTAVDLRPMPVERDDLDRAASAYAAELPERFDLVHLGLGPDGHTASLVPGDPVCEVTDRLVAMTDGDYQGHRRMTMTYQALSRADQLLWVVTGAEKAPAVRKLLDGDRSIPAGRVQAESSLVMADAAAAEGAEQ